MVYSKGLSRMNATAQFDGVNHDALVMKHVHTVGVVGRSRATDPWLKLEHCLSIRDMHTASDTTRRSENITRSF